MAFARWPRHWRFLELIALREAGVGTSARYCTGGGAGGIKPNRTTFLVIKRSWQVAHRNLPSGAPAVRRRRLNTRLYFNRLPRPNLLAAVPNGGTPGAPNSRAGLYRSSPLAHLFL
jgi:hypothetical protein